MSKILQEHIIHEQHQQEPAKLLRKSFWSSGPLGRFIQRHFRHGRALFSVLSLLFLAFWTLIVIIPLWVLISVAIKSAPDFLSNPLGWPHEFEWSNFTSAWDVGAIGQSLVNSVLITVCSLAGLVIAGSMAAYPLARSAGRVMNGIYFYFVIGLLIPAQIGVIALYRLMRDLSLISTYQGVVLIYIATSLPFVIFLYTGFIKSIPGELEEAARIDGASRLRTFWSIVFPLLGPVTATAIITSSFSIWNDFFTALLFLQDPNKQTLPLALFNFEGSYNNQWTLIFASITIATLPMVVAFLFLQRYFVRGITGGALKG